MLFGRRNRRANVPTARPVSVRADHALGLKILSNGPETPVMDIAAMKRALDHAAWRDPSFERRKIDEIKAAIRTLERTAACVDLAQERLTEAAETLVLGQASPEQVMRGLLTARFEELLDSLERVTTLAQDGPVNLLAGSGQASMGQTTPHRGGQVQAGLSLDIGTAGFSYVLTPIDIRRGRGGLDIPVLESGFDDDSENYQVQTAVLKAQQRLNTFGERLSHDATMLVNIAQAHEALHTPVPTISVAHENESVALKTNREDAA